MANLGNFNPNEHEPNQSFDVIPDGWYQAVAINSEMKHTKSGTGQYLEIDFQIIDGPYKGQHVWSRLNLINPKPKAVQIANGDLSAICKAIGKTSTVRDSSELHNTPLMIKIKVKPAEGPYDASNDVKGYKSVAQAAHNGAGGFPVSPAAPVANATSHPVATPTGRAPWEQG